MFDVVGLVVKGIQMGRPREYKYYGKPPAMLGPVKVRSCLKCRKEFNSDGLRICPECTEENQKTVRSKRDLVAGLSTYSRKGGIRSAD